MWTISHDGGYRYGQATTNMIESFNGLLRSAQFTAMVGYIYYRFVKLIAKKRTRTLDDLQNGQFFLLKIKGVIEQKASAHTVIPYNEQRGVFEIIFAQYRTKNGS